jgi:hypothetical protein
MNAVREQVHLRDAEGPMPVLDVTDGELRSSLDAATG